MATEFRLPELGENIESCTVTNVLVSVGDAVAVDQPVLEIETEKAVAEVPSPASGTVSEVRAKQGEQLRVGDVILVIADADAAPEPTPADKQQDQADTSEPAAA